MKKIFYAVFFCFALLLTGCSASDENEINNNIEAFLTELYQVEHTEQYEEFRVESEKFAKENNFSEKGNGSLDKELYQAFVSKYEPYCSENAIELMMQNGYLMKYEMLAWNENDKFFVEDIKIKEDKTGKQYTYEIVVEKEKEDGTKQRQKGMGILKLNEENKVDWLNIVKELKDAE